MPRMNVMDAVVKVMEVKREKFLYHTFVPGFRSELHH